MADPLGDVEIIALGADILEALGLADKIRLELNTLGDPDSRKRYREALVAFFSKNLDQLSEDSRERLERNPLRILDSKDRKDRAVVADAPRFADYLSDESAAFFETVKTGLTALGIAYELNPHLVRGLDYYCHTAFEFKTDQLGAQDTVMGGGRYDYLMETMGGPALPGVGWAAGVERLALLLAEEPERVRPILMVPVSGDQEAAALVLAQDLRRAGFTVETSFGGAMKKRMKLANRIGARFALLLGEDEVARKAVTLRDLDSGEQQELAQGELAQRLAALT